MNDRVATRDGSLTESALHYDNFFGPMYFEPYALAVADRIDIGPKSVVLELAAGTGRVTRHIRKKLPASAVLVASDISWEMLATARDKLRQLDIDWQYIDAQRLPFGESSIDLVICCFGYMFIPDRPKAIAEAYRVLKPGGTLLFTTWDKLENNGASYAAVSIAKTYLQAPLPESYGLSTSMHKEEDVKALLNNAGFIETTIEKVQLSAVCSTAKEAAEGLASGEIFDDIQMRDPAGLEELKAKLESELAGKYGAAPMVAPMSALVIRAWK